MFQNYLVTALRNIARHRLYSFINIAGLAVGLACVIFVLLFARDELSYDSWIPGTQNLYRVEKIAHTPGRTPLEIATMPFPMPAAMRDEIPEVTAMTRIGYQAMTVMVGNRQFLQGLAMVDPNFLQVIKLPLLKGDPATVFREPESVVLSQSAARKYFGATDAIGKTIRTTANCEVADAQCLNRLVPLKVTGILRDIPHNSQLDGDVFIPNTSITNRMGQREKASWFSNASFGYVVLAPGARPGTVVAKMGPVLDRNVTGDLHANGDNRRGSQAYAIHLTPFTEVHLTSGRWRGNQTPAGSWTTLYGVGIVGILILFLACFNFTNLATAMAATRAREIALRKTLGANRGQLIVQFLGEAMLTALLSLVLAMALVEVLHATFEHLLQHAIAIPYVSAWPLILVLLAATAGLISGVYPALVLSGFRPAAVLRAGTAGPAGSGRLRTALVVLQFAVSIGLGIAVLVVFSQINFARAIDLGFRKDNLLVVSGGRLTLDGRASVIQRLRSNPDILDVAMIDTPPFNRSFTLASAQLPGRPEHIPLYRRAIGTNAVHLLGMKLVAGRLLSDQRAQDRMDISDMPGHAAANDGHNILIDQAASVSLGFTPQQAVGQAILVGTTHMRIAGVLADVKFDGAREPAKASFYVYDPDAAGYAIVRIRPDAMPRTLSFIDKAWHDFAPTKAVSRYFLDDDFAKLYRVDERQGEMFGIFVIVAVFISCLGLFGLAALTASRRTREIGIRKVFGARTRDVTLLLLWQFSVPVLVANLIAWPLAWYYLHNWLQGFAYRIALGPLYFVGAGLVALAIAWVTIFAHTWRVARANPVIALRTE